MKAYKKCKDQETNIKHNLNIGVMIKAIESSEHGINCPKYNWKTIMLFGEKVEFSIQVYIQYSSHLLHIV